MMNNSDDSSDTSCCISLLIDSHLLPLVDSVELIVLYNPLYPTITHFQDNVATECGLLTPYQTSLATVE